MAEAFTPRFVDLVRNITTTTGTGDFLLGAAVSGFTNFNATIHPGETFYYSCVGIDRPGEREIGRGTMRTNGRISRDPINGTLTNFSAGTKTIALIAAAEWFEKVQSGGGNGPVRIKTPFDFGAKGDGVADDAAALNAFFAFAAANRGYKYLCDGDFAVGSALVIDVGEYGTDPTFAIDFGQCRITAKAAVSRLLTIRDCIGGKFAGHLHLRGTNAGADNSVSWTCDVGLYLDNFNCSVLPDLRFEGFAFAGAEVAHHPSSNNSVKWGHVSGKRIGSGAPYAGLSRTANFSAAVKTGAFGSPWLTQYSTINVDALPCVYAQQNNGAAASPPNHPTRPVFVEIAGRLHQVSYISPTTLRIYPALKASVGTSGTLKYHYGGLVCIYGNDSNIHDFEHVSGVYVGCAMEIGCLYGPTVQTLHAEGSGCSVRVATAPDSQVFGGRIGLLYCEGDTFNVAFVGAATTQFEIGALSGQSEDFSKWINVFESLIDTNAYTASRFPVAGVGSAFGSHVPLRFGATTGAVETLDFNAPRTFAHPVFLTHPVLDDASFTLVAPEDSHRNGFGYQSATVTVIGRGENGKPTGYIVFTPPAGHSINGGAASAALTFSAFSGPVSIAVSYAGSGAWIVRAIAGVGGQVSVQTGANYVASLADANGYVRLSSGAAATLTVPANSAVPFPVGTEIAIEQAGPGAVSVVGATGVTINSRGSDLTLAGQYAVAGLKKVATDSWTLTGDL